MNPLGQRKYFLSWLRLCRSCLVILIALHLQSGVARATVADFLTPDIDIWSYDQGGSPGTRAQGSTFTGGFELDSGSSKTFEFGP